jgi:4-amino-4-deoxy-L-arabinose transferase-like glycosyltransferase
MMDYACPIWRYATRSYVRKLQVFQSKCLRIATGAPWYICNRQIHEDLGVPFFDEHIRAPTESYDSKIAGVGNPLAL